MMGRFLAAVLIELRLTRSARRRSRSVTRFGLLPVQQRQESNDFAQSLVSII
jgi:hypothetical protein